MPKNDLAPGFEEVPLQEGFEEVPLTKEEPSIYQQFLDKAKSTGQTAQDLAQGAGKSMLSTQIVPAMTASTSSLTGQSPDLSWAEKYRQAQDILQQDQKQSQARSPIAFKTGEIGGIVAPSLLTGGAAAGIRGLAPSLAEKVAVGSLTGAGIGGVQGASTSEGHLIDSTPEERKQLGRDTAEGVITGGLIGGGLSLAAPVVKAGFKGTKDYIGSKLSNYIADSPFLEQMGEIRDLGKKGTNVYSEKAIQGPIGENSGLIHQDTNAAMDLTTRLLNGKQMLGQAVGKSLDDAANKGIVMDATEPMINSVNTFKNLLEKDQTLMADPNAKKLYDTIFKMAGEDGQFDSSNLTPKEVQSLIQDVGQFSDNIKLKSPEISNLGNQFVNQASDLLKQTIPEYKIASERYYEFNKLIPETLIAGSTPVEISGVWLGNLKNNEGKLFKSAKDMIQGSRMPGFGSSNSKETYKNFINGIDQFEKNDATRIEQGLIKQEDIPKLIDSTDKSQASAVNELIKKRSDQSAMLQQAWRINPQETVGTSIKGAMFGRSGAMNLANKYGLYKDTLTKPITTPVELTKKLYNSSEDQLRGVAEHMSTIPGLQSIGKTLTQGLDNKDVTGVNAAIFSIMQNPQARIIINGEENLGSEKEKK